MRILSFSFSVIFFLCFGELITFDSAVAQSQLPACEINNSYWDNCYASRKIGNGSLYVGEWKEGKPNGKGTINAPDGTKYVGQWRDGVFDGPGVLTTPTGDKFSGEFKNGKVNGWGTLNQSNGVEYQGNFKDNKKHGQGTEIKISDNSYWKYSGEWKNDKPNGKGIFSSPTLNYVGEWKDALYHGKGVIKFASGEQYEGEFREGKYSGFGEWKSNTPNDQKKFMNQATNYIGQWKDNKYDGEGSLIFSSGEKYVGQFKVGEYSGLGILYSSDGSIRLMGLWDRNKFIRSENVTTSQNNSANKNLNPNDQPMARSGTGFRIALGHFVTNNHVIEGCKNILINKSLEGSIEIADKSKDLAIISVPNDSGAVSHLRSTSVKLNESITVSGFPLEGAFSGIAITNGTVSRVTGLKGDTSQIQISAPVQPGNSGGPLLDKSGNVVGVVSSKLNATKVAEAIGDIPQNVNFAISGSALIEFLKSMHVEYSEANDEGELSGVQIAERASGFTVLIECR